MRADPDARLDSGMKVTEAIRRAEAWWGEYRGAIRRDFNRQRAAPRVRASMGRAPGLIVMGEVSETLPDGILSGKPWDQLSDREKLTVTKQWHEHHVRQPMMEAAKHKMLGGAIQ